MCSIYVLLWTASKGIESGLLCCDEVQGGFEHSSGLRRRRRRCMHLQETLARSRYPSAAFKAYLSYAVTRIFITIISAATTASARSATSLCRMLAKAPLGQSL